MVINLICKSCNNEQIVDIKEIEGELLYKCKYCNHDMSYGDTNRLLALFDLQTFELHNTYDPSNNGDIFLLERMFEKIKMSYHNKSDEIKDKIFHLIDLLDRITDYKDTESILRLCETVEKCYKEIIRKEHEKMSKLLGIENNEALSDFYNL